MEQRISNEFVHYGQITPAGQQVIQHIETTLRVAEATNDVEELNKLGGHIKHYYVNVMKLETLTPSGFLESYPNAARAVAGYLRDLAESQAKETAERDERTRLSESLDDVKAALALAMQRIAELEAKQAAETPEMDAEESAPAPEPVKTKKG